MKNIIFLDLDGTLINPRNRYFSIYKKICKEAGIASLNSNIYWKLKRNKIPEYDILKITNINIKKIPLILKKRIGMLEDDKFLKLDKLHLGVIDFLKLVTKKKYLLVLVTYRRKKNSLKKQLEFLNIIHFFDKILSVNSYSKTKYMGKVNLIKKYYQANENNFFFGDTDVDLLAGKRLKIKTVACIFGIRNKLILRKFKPNFSISNWRYKTWDKKLLLSLGI